MTNQSKNGNPIIAVGRTDREPGKRYEVRTFLWTELCTAASKRHGDMKLEPWPGHLDMEKLQIAVLLGNNNGLLC